MNIVKASTKMLSEPKDGSGRLAAEETARNLLILAENLIKAGKLSQDDLNNMVERTKKGGAEIVKYLEKGSAFYAPAAAGVQMADSFLNDKKEELPCAAFLDGEYGVKNIYAGVPVIIGKNGVEKIVEINLSSEEKGQFDKSIKAVKDLFDAAKKIDNLLG